MEKIRWRTGDLISVSPTEGSHPATNFIVDVKGNSLFSMAYMERPYHRINVLSSGDIEVRNCVGKNSFFQLESVASSNSYRIKSSVPIKMKLELDERKTEQFVYLGFQVATNVLGGIPEYSLINQQGSRECYTEFDIKTVKEFSYNSSLSYPSSASVPRVLSAWDMRQMKADGYIHLRDVVLPQKIRECAHVIMHHLGVPGSLTAGGAQDGLGKLGGGLSNCQELKSLILYPKCNKGQVSLLDIIEEVLGSKTVDESCFSAQVALRFPEYVKDSKVCCESNRFTQCLDGSYPIGSTWHTDGLRQGKFHGFSLLVGVCLSDCEFDFCGNLLVWPGSHLPIHRSLKGSDGEIDVGLLSSLINDSTHNEMQQGHYRGGGKQDCSLSNLPNLGIPLQLKLKAGDVVFLHPETAHCGGPNFSHLIRNMVYFRIKRKDINEMTEIYKEDMWADMPEIRNQ